MTREVTYVFCVLAGTTAKLRGAPRGLPGMGAVRALDMGRGLYVIVASVPLGEYDEPTINQRLSDLDWVSRNAVAHEAVIEHFIDAAAVLPMKLFTIFSSDDRALEHFRAERPRIDAIVRRVAKHHEWGVRVLLDRAKAVSTLRSPTSAAVGRRGRPRRQPHATTGVAYLTRKKVQRDSSLELASRAREIVTGLYDELAKKARLARRRPALELAARRGSLLLDAAFLVPRARDASFRALAARHARALAKRGYVVTLSGPWPPYTFVQD